jgi:hypothetical protein
VEFRNRAPLSFLVANIFAALLGLRLFILAPP